jgi:hypothetical protein
MSVDVTQDNLSKIMVNMLRAKKPLYVEDREEIAALIERQEQEILELTKPIVFTDNGDDLESDLQEELEQIKYAELGRLAVEAIDKVDQYTGQGRYTTLPCGYESPCHRDWYRDGEMHPTQCPKCTWQDFCRKRAELIPPNSRELEGAK